MYIRECDYNELRAYTEAYMALSAERRERANKPMKWETVTILIADPRTRETSRHIRLREDGMVSVVTACGNSVRERFSDVDDAERNLRANGFKTRDEWIAIIKGGMTA